MPGLWVDWWGDSMGINGHEGVVKEISQQRANEQAHRRGCDVKSLLQCCGFYEMPLVLCPWGCSEFSGAAGSVPFDLILQQTLRHVELPMLSDRAMLKRTNFIRSDYMRTHQDDYECFSLNPSWRVLPSIHWETSRGPMFATCRHHVNGEAKQHFPHQSLKQLPSRPRANP